jgi:hypothetical protein
LRLRRIGPIITPETHPSLGTNINGPSLIRTPSWIPGRPGKYSLYFGHHQGKHIRLAYADDLSGPWRIRHEGALQLDDTPCHNHIASPDVHVDESRQRIIMYYHGPILSDAKALKDPLTRKYPMLGGQRTLVATSHDGVNFTSNTEILGSSYMRVFHWRGMAYGLAMPGLLYRSKDGLTDFREGPTLFDVNMRHSGIQLHGDRLTVFYSNAGDAPERILASDILLNSDWHSWQPGKAVTVLSPDVVYEGGDLPIGQSIRGAAHSRCRQLRDPFFFEDRCGAYLLYSIAGEMGLGLAESEPSSNPPA